MPESSRPGPRLPSGVTTADLRDAAAILRERARRILANGDYSPNGRARHIALRDIADYLDARALADGG